MSSLEKKLEEILPLVSKPSRYLGNEFHVVRKTPEPGMVQWCLLLPEVYEIGMSHWGLKVLYEVLNSRPDALAERGYAPWFDMEEQMRRHEIPLYALESKRPVVEFDFVGFSLQYELTYTNVLQCLDLAGIPLRAEDRRESDPLIIAGGPCVSNPEPLSDFIDLYLIGDGEEVVHSITDAYQKLRGRPRMEILREMSKLPGIYVPLMYEATYGPDDKLLGTTPKYDDVPKRVKRQFVVDLENAPVPSKPIVPLQDIVQNRLTVEVLRGCTQGCRFCQAGYLYRPIRERSVEKVLEIANEGIKESGWDEVGLVSLSTADYTQLEPLADVLNKRFSKDRVGISLPSLRADSFGIEVAEKVKETKKTGFTFAPEVGSERLRLAINKLIRDQEFYDAAEVAYSRGWNLIKIYFMVGLPTETWEDVEGIVRFINTVREIGFKHNKRNTVNASIGSFVPKSHTPFQWDGFEPNELLKEKIQYVRRKSNSRWSRVKWHDVETSHLEAIFSMGDRRLGPAIEWAFRNGARFDGWTEHFNYERWMYGFGETGVEPAHHTRKRGFDEPLPWDHIDILVSKKWLERERIKTEKAEFEVGKSLVTDCRHGDCTACGIPTLPFDTQLTPALDQPEIDRLLKKAEADAPRREDSGIVWPVRVRFRKFGAARFLSHLEMGSVLARAFRMARISLAHTQGHVPRPKIGFGPSLPVGIEGENEAFDADLMSPWNKSFVTSLNEVLPEGIEILDGHTNPVIPGVKRRSITAIAQRGLYSLDLSRLDSTIRKAISDKMEAFATLDSCVVDRQYWTPQSSREATDWESPALNQVASSGGDEEGSGARGDGRNRRRPSHGRKGRHGKPERNKTVDLKRAIVSAQLAGGGLGLRLELHLAREDGQVANPKVILEQLFELGPEEQARVPIVRHGLLDAEGMPLFKPGRSRVAPPPAALKIR